MVFNNNNKNRETNANQPPAVNQFHTRTNIRDRSLDNWHGDADFAQTMNQRRFNAGEDDDDLPPPLE
jgi:hypothetical protein